MPLRSFIACLLLALASSLDATAGTMKIGTVAWVGYGPFYVAEQKGMFRKAGVDVQLKMFNDPAEIPPAIAGGSLQGGMVTINQVIAAVVKGQVQKIVMPIDFSNGADAIVAPLAMNSLAELKGRKIGLAQLTPSDILLGYALRTAGVADRDVTFINMAPDAIPAAMTSGQLEVGVTWEPMLSQLLAMEKGKRYKVIYSSRQAPGLIADVLVFDQKVIAANPKEIETVVRIYLQALDWTRKNPDEAARIVAKAMSISPREVKEQLPLVRNVAAADMPKAFAKSADPLSFHTSGAITGEILRARGEIDRIPAVSEYAEARFVEAAVAGR
jgi:NitT/TauT family transport system substrate-binding protein